MHLISNPVVLLPDILELAKMGSEPRFKLHYAILFDGDYFADEMGNLGLFPVENTHTHTHTHTHTLMHTNIKSQLATTCLMPVKFFLKIRKVLGEEWERPGEVMGDSAQTITIVRQVGNLIL